MPTWTQGIPCIGTWIGAPVKHSKEFMINKTGYPWRPVAFRKLRCNLIHTLHFQEIWIGNGRKPYRSHPLHTDVSKTDSKYGGKFRNSVPFTTRGSDRQIPVDFAHRTVAPWPQARPARSFPRRVRFSSQLKNCSWRRLRPRKGSAKVCHQDGTRKLWKEGEV
jgi:hypothetical protein